MLSQIKQAPCISVLDAITKAIGIHQITDIMAGDTKVSETVANVIFERGQLDELKLFLGVDESPEITYISQLWA